MNILKRIIARISKNAERPEKLRVGYVLWAYPALSQSFVHSEIQWLLNHGVDIKVYYKDNPDKYARLNYEIKKYRIKNHAELANLAIKHRLDILHSHFAYPAGTLLTWPAAEAVSIPFTLMPHAYDIFINDYAKVNRLGEMARSSVCKALFAYGPFHRDFFINEGVPAEKVVLKPQSFERSLIDSEFKISDRTIRKVVFVGRFIEKKGLDDFIKVADRVKDLDLVFEIYGYGPLEKEVKEAVKGMRNVRLHIGGVPHEEYANIIREADLFFLPCKRAKNGDMDGLPTVIMESAAIGLPVLTSSLSSIPLLMEDGVTGFVCEPGDVLCFEKKLRSLVGRRPDEFAEIIKAARQRITELCHPDNVNKKLIDTWSFYTGSQKRGNE